MEILINRTKSNSGTGSTGIFVQWIRATFATVETVVKRHESTASVWENVGVLPTVSRDIPDMVRSGTVVRTFRFRSMELFAGQRRNQMVRSRSSPVGKTSSHDFLKISFTV